MLTYKTHQIKSLFQFSTEKALETIYSRVENSKDFIQDLNSAENLEIDKLSILPHKVKTYLKEYLATPEYVVIHEEYTCSERFVHIEKYKSKLWLERLYKNNLRESNINILLEFIHGQGINFLLSNILICVAIFSNTSSEL